LPSSTWWVRHREHRRPVSVGNIDGDIDGALFAGGIDRAERQCVAAGLVEPWRPLEHARRAIEECADGQRRQRRIEHGILIDVARQQGELQQRAFPPGLRRHRDELGRPVHIVDVQGDRLEARLIAVRHREHDAWIVASGEEVRRPGERAGLGAKLGAGR
jgi:hypothetical protein